MTRAHRSLLILTTVTVLAAGMTAQTLTEPAGAGVDSIRRQCDPAGHQRDTAAASHAPPQSHASPPCGPSPRGASRIHSRRHNWIRILNAAADAAQSSSWRKFAAAEWHWPK